MENGQSEKLFDGITGSTRSRKKHGNNPVDHFPAHRRMKLANALKTEGKCLDTSIAMRSLRRSMAAAKSWRASHTLRYFQPRRPRRHGENKCSSNRQPPGPVRRLVWKQSGRNYANAPSSHLLRASVSSVVRNARQHEHANQADRQDAQIPFIP